MHVFFERIEWQKALAVDEIFFRSAAADPLAQIEQRDILLLAPTPGAEDRARFKQKQMEDTMAINSDPAAQAVKTPETKRVTKEELLAKAYKPAEDAMKLHPFYKGKLETSPKCCIRDFDDFAIWYTPGVAEVCKDIHKNPEKVYEHTNKGNTVVVVTDGTRVLAWVISAPRPVCR